MRARIGTGVLMLGILLMGCGGDNEEGENASTDATAVETGAGEEGEEPSETENSEGSEEEEEATEVEKGSLGDSCASDDECASPSGYPTCITTTLIKTLGLSDSAEVPDGYCSDMTCGASSECGEGAVQCVDLGASEVTDLFNICLKGCEAGGACGEGQQCYCDEDGGIFNTEGDTDFCTCMPEAIIDLLT